MADVIQTAGSFQAVMFSVLSPAAFTCANDIDLPDNVLDALSQLYWSERYPAACG